MTLPNIVTVERTSIGTLLVKTKGQSDFEMWKDDLYEFKSDVFGRKIWTYADMEKELT
jgi:hypothetical protein